MFENISAAAPDAIIGLTETYKADKNPAKINLAVGVYKDAKGNTPTLAAVQAAEIWLQVNEPNKAYLGIDGSPGYCQSVRKLLFGESDRRVSDGTAVTFQTPGGTGALRVAADYLAVNHAGVTVWLSDPTWPNHPGIFQAAGLTTKTYPYLDREAGTLAFDAMCEAFKQVAAGDVVLLHGCCHNPTGVDPTVEQWRTLAELIRNRGALPLVDFAYQGFAQGIQEDAAGLRTVAEVCDELIVCSSFSKNFGLYRERVGAMTVVAASAEVASNVQSQVKTCIRRNYSNPPAHGGLVVEHILSDTSLTTQWLEELTAMRERVNQIRKALRESLDKRGVNLKPTGNGFIERQNGMFTMSGLTKEQVLKLRSDHAIYIVGSGRINVAGITPDNLDTLCDAIAAVR